ncbi:MAG: PIN domain-containing protein [Novosphingobium sp.]|nr:PIN domain-containing protein [Novosphingobium sp.]
MPTAFLDTNVFLYAAMHRLPKEDVHKRPIADRLVYEENYCLSTQVLAEFYYNALRKGDVKMTHAEAMAWMSQMALQPCVTVDANLVRTGASLADRYQLSYWDGAIIAAAHDLGASVLYTEDLNDGQFYGDVQAINPFKNIPN